MKMIRAIIRPEAERRVAGELAEAGLGSLTKIDVFGRGKQKGIQVGSLHYDELPKVLVLLVVEDEKVDQALEIITRAAVTGSIGDGKIFVSPVEEAYTIRTGAKGL